ncbi:MAG: hypothetical protein QM648_05855 [Solirubrobacterales bacterium]
MTARKVAHGKADEFFETFARGPETMPEEIRSKFKAVYACTSVDDPDEVLTFGLFDGTIEEFRDLQSQQGRSDQLESIDPLVEQVMFDDSFEVVRQMMN